MAHAIKRTGINTSAIINDKKKYDFTEDDDYRLVLKQVLKYFETSKSETNANLNIEAADLKLTKEQEKKVKKASKKKDTVSMAIPDILEEVTSTIGMENPLKELVNDNNNNNNNNNINNDTNTNSKIPNSKNEFGYDWPLSVECNGLLWTYSMTLPPVIETTYKVVRAFFPQIKDSDINGKNIVLYPPTNEKEGITIVQRAAHGCAARIICCFGSDEQFDFNVSQGNHNANTKYLMFTNDMIMMNFGICSSLAFSFNNDKSYLYKRQESDRGARRTKNPAKRWIMVIDFISDTDAMSKEFKKVTKEAAKGDETVQKKLEEKMEGLIKDTDIVARSVAAKAAAQKQKQSEETVNNNTQNEETTNNNSQKQNDIEDKNVTKVETMKEDLKKVMSEIKNEDKQVKNDDKIIPPKKEERKISRQERRAAEREAEKKAKNTPPPPPPSIPKSNEPTTEDVMKKIQERRAQEWSIEDDMKNLETNS